MTLEIAFLFILLAGMAYCFFTEKLSVDLTAWVGLSILIVLGFVTPEEAFEGFASSAVITMLSIFIVSGALLRTGVADVLGSKLHQVFGSREVPLIIAVTLVSAALSAFMNNIAAAAVLLPAVASLAQSAKVPPSRLLMPLSFGVVLGGMTTLVGTPPNILAGEMLLKNDMTGFGLFAYTPMGLCMVSVGTLYLITIGRKLMPHRNIGNENRVQDDLSQAYQIKENLFSLGIPEQSNMVGQTLEEAKLGSALGIQVVGILRDGKSTLAPSARTMIQAGDTLVVKGSVEELRETMRVRGVEIEDSKDEHFQRARKHVQVTLARVKRQSLLIGKTVREIHFRRRYKASLVAIRREGAFLEYDLAGIPLREGDTLYIVRGQAEDDGLEHQQDFTIAEPNRRQLRDLRAHTFVLVVTEESGLSGQTVAGCRLNRLVGVTVVGIIRDDRLIPQVAPDDLLREGDQLFVTGDTSQIRDLIDMGEVHIHDLVDDMDLESRKVGVMEATVAPRSAAAGHTLAELKFRDRYGLQVLSVWREGQSVHGNLADLRLQFGDALFLQGPWQKIQLFAEDDDFVVLSDRAHKPRNTRKAPYAIGALLLMILLVIIPTAPIHQPVHVAAFISATLVVLFGTMTMEEAYRSVEWRVVFLVAAVLPVGNAMEHTGAAALISETMTHIAGPYGPYAVLAGFCLLASFLSQTLDGSPAVVLLTPIALNTAVQLGISPYTLMMGISLSASVAFMTPFSHKAHLLVMGAGGYRFVDYLKVGTPLTIILIVVELLLVPVFFPF